MKRRNPINVTKTYLPPIEEFEYYVQKIWNSGQLTNNGALLREFEERIGHYLDVDNFQFVTNGTLALQLAIRGLGIESGEIITTPFSYVATASAILWERCTPVFIDIDSKTLNIDPSLIEAAITPNTKAIMAVHVFGNPCDVIEIEKVAKKHELKVIFDAAHAFGVSVRDKSVFSYGDISACSFHATKLFHTIEGGGIVSSSARVSKKINLMKRFGHDGDDHYELGINAKASEFQAAMGLSNLLHIKQIINQRRFIYGLYDSLLESVDSVRGQHIAKDVSYNYAYYPVIFESETQLKRVFSNLENHNVFPRRYFYPSLNRLPYINDGQDCPISEDIASRIACLPLYAGLEFDEVEDICEIIKQCID